MRILGIDPGLQRMGWGIISVQGNRLRYVADGVAQSDTQHTLANRLLMLHSQIAGVIVQHQPQAVAIEKTLVNVDAQNSLKLAHARAVAMLCAAQHNLPVCEYAPNTIKKAATGAGHATKEHMVHMMRLLLPGCVLQTTDAADALAIAVCHAHHAPALII